jgi:hypothetical protein
LEIFFGNFYFGIFILEIFFGNFFLLKIKNLLKLALFLFKVMPSLGVLRITPDAAQKTSSPTTFKHLQKQDCHQDATAKMPSLSMVNKHLMNLLKTCWMLRKVLVLPS